MTEIEELIRQAETMIEEWRRDRQEPLLTARRWQEMPDGVPYPLLSVKNL